MNINFRPSCALRNKMAQVEFRKVKRSGEDHKIYQPEPSLSCNQSCLNHRLMGLLDSTDFKYGDYAELDIDTEFDIQSLVRISEIQQSVQINNADKNVVYCQYHG